jgi:hypothetical protein
VLVEQPRPLRPQPRDAGHLDKPRRDAPPELLQGGDRPGLEQDVELVGERLAHTRELIGASLACELGDRHPGLADGLGGVAVGEHAVHDRAVQLVEAGQLVEGVCDL